MPASNPKQPNEYDQQAEAFLSRFGIDFRAVLVGDDCPLFCDDAAKDRDMDKINTYPRKTHIHGKHYRCTFSRAGKGHFSIDFWNSYRDAEQNHCIDQGWTSWNYDSLPLRHPFRQYKGLKRSDKATVRAYDVLACLQKDDPGSFEDFCSSYGYDTDSRRAEETYNAVKKEWLKLSKFFTAEEIKQLQEIN